VFLVISVYFNIRNTLSKSGRFLLGHPVYGGEHPRIGAICHRRQERERDYWFHVIQDGAPVVTGSSEYVVYPSVSSEGICSIELIRTMYVS
jgi:hypothetical protein